ncbi:Polyhydroxybutyrate depolymerase (fragment) [Mesorhizobium metallidurans STM 2683]|uniref:Polyhydroxybutyrate depolymerase n=1 Tax=Mesorhizobium metallidurans STM 2683 TaxID=1297569 RepID=M5EN81_9HYPH
MAEDFNLAGLVDNTVVPSNADSILAQWQGVHDVGISPTRTESVDGQTRQVWCDVDGHRLIEKYTIVGMGHGTPLKTSRDDGLGPAPYMLDVGVSSTRRIAEFWGITTGVQGARAANISADGTARSETMLPAARETSEKPLGRVLACHAPGSKACVAKVIEEALRAAGLMRK